MRKIFIPRQLTLAAQRIREAHKETAEISLYEVDEEFIKQLKYWAGLPEDSIQDEAIVIPMRRILQLANYVSTNTYKLPLKNLNRILYIRANEEVFRYLFQVWQNVYFNVEFNQLLVDILTNKKGIEQATWQGTYLTGEIFIAWIRSTDVVNAVGRTITSVTFKSTDKIEKRLQEMGLHCDSPLARNCIAMFYTYCRREEYLLADDAELLSAIKHYDLNGIHAFLHNILKTLRVQDFQKYIECGALLRNNYTGVPQSKMFIKFFAGYPQELVVQYQHWLDYVIIWESFGKDDERLQFWSMYVPYSKGAALQRRSMAFVMQFAFYCIIEFPMESMGPIYIYRRDVFENKIDFWVGYYSNAVLKSKLYEHRAECAKRITHQGDWKSRTSLYLTANSVIA
jgi:hypothetical protein